MFQFSRTIFVKSPFQTHPLTYNLNSIYSVSQIMPPITPVQHFSPLEELSLSRIHGQSGHSSTVNMKEAFHHPLQIKSHFNSTVGCKNHKVCIFHSELVNKHSSVPNGVITDRLSKRITTCLIFYFCEFFYIEIYNFGGTTHKS